MCILYNIPWICGVEYFCLHLLAVLFIFLSSIFMVKCPIILFSNFTLLKQSLIFFSPPYCWCLSCRVTHLRTQLQTRKQAQCVRVCVCVCFDHVSSVWRQTPALPFITSLNISVHAFIDYIDNLWTFTLRPIKGLRIYMGVSYSHWLDLYSGWLSSDRIYWRLTKLFKLQRFMKCSSLTDATKLWQ